MTAEELASVTLEHLRAIRAKQDEQGDELAAIRLELSAMGQQMLRYAFTADTITVDLLKSRPGYTA